MFYDVWLIKQQKIILNHNITCCVQKILLITTQNAIISFQKALNFG